MICENPNCQKILVGRDQVRFCSRTCSAIVNNQLHPKRTKKPKQCQACGISIDRRSKFCPSCSPKERWRAAAIDLTKNSNEGLNRSIRGRARIAYKNSGRPMACALCEYSKHVDICHIVDIRNHPHGTPEAVVNAQSNLLALCRNHHWEFDHDML